MKTLKMKTLYFYLSIASICVPITILLLDKRFGLTPGIAHTVIDQHTNIHQNILEQETENTSIIYKLYEPTANNNISEQKPVKKSKRFKHKVKYAKVKDHKHTKRWMEIAQKSRNLSQDLNLTEPILTLFTTMKDVAYRKNIHLNTLKNWASLAPWLVPVLFVRNITSDMLNTTSWGYLAIKHGWKVLEYTHTKKDIPVLKTMFKDIKKLQLGTLFIGYSNADILYEDNLIHTLRHFTLAANITINSTDIFITGRRSNVREELLDLIADSELPARIALIARDHMRHGESAADYVITTEHGINWTAVPDFVIGRTLYDTWLLAMATQWGLTHLDMTETVIAAHQTGIDGNRAGHTINNSTNSINIDMIDHSEARFVQITGRQLCAPLISTFDKSCKESYLPECIRIDYQVFKTINSTCKLKFSK